MEDDFSGRSYRKQRNFYKGSPVSARLESSERKFVLYFFKAFFDTSFKLSDRFSVKWSWTEIYQFWILLTICQNFYSFPDKRCYDHTTTESEQY